MSSFSTVITTCANDDQAIVALCTPSGSGAIGLIRISGINAFNIADAIADCKSKKLSAELSHTIHHGHVVDKETGEIFDDVMFFIMRAPRTFTGQDTIEITCHNNPFIIENIITTCLKYGARLARPGEFTRRSFLSGKIDLIQAEAIYDLIHAPSEKMVKASLVTLNGSLSHFLHTIEKQILSLLGYVEASFEFLDEEQRDFDFATIISEQLHIISTSIDASLITFDQRQQIRDGIRIAIIGSANAGKSTLFNALIGRDRAIVTDIPGTTRDSIEAGIYKDSNHLLFIDTAGIRKTNDNIELHGIQRSYEEAIKADIILLVVDGSKNIDQEELVLYQNFIHIYDKKIICLYNKSDIAFCCDSALNHATIIHVSAKIHNGINDVYTAIKNKIQHLYTQHTMPFLLNKRQYAILQEVHKKLHFIIDNYIYTLEYELMAYNVRLILEDLSELTGKNVTEMVLDKVFEEFCVGK